MPSVVRKAKRDTDQTSESECDSGKENQRHSRILSHPKGSAGKKLSKDTKPKQSDWWSNLYTFIFIYVHFVSNWFSSAYWIWTSVSQTLLITVYWICIWIIMFTPAQILWEAVQNIYLLDSLLRTKEVGGASTLIRFRIIEKLYTLDKGFAVVQLSGHFINCPCSSLLKLLVHKNDYTVTGFT